MRRNTNVALVSLGLLLGTAGCDSFLTGNKLSENPNLPTIASIQPLFVGIQAGQFAFQEGTVAMMMCEWVQACSAGNGRFVQQAAQYVFGETSNIGANGGDWLTAYGGGGLIDIKTIEALALGAGDSTWLGIAEIWDAFTIGTIADMWGDVPYSEIGTSRTPVLDNQMTIYANIQTLLSNAIRHLASNVGAGPGVRDLVFANLSVAAERAAWIRIARTMKARYYMHTAESLGVPAYTNAIAEALLGINDATGNSDFRSFHTTKNSERNMWAQFQTSSGFGTDLEAGKFLVDYMKARKDPRLGDYFCPLTVKWAKNHKYRVGNGIAGGGFLQVVTAVTGNDSSGTVEPTWNTTLGGTTVDNNVTWTNRGQPYGGDDQNTPPDASTVSLFACQPPRFADDARIPYVTYVENELILAEAYNKTGNDALAATHLNNAYATVPGLASVAAGTGAVLLDSIMREKYVSMFQNIESINDYRRTCIPAVTPSPNSQGFRNVPGRLFYPQTERNANSNIPDPTVQIGAHFFRNRADVLACTVQGVP